jgi:hypothetical protein
VIDMQNKSSGSPPNHTDQDGKVGTAREYIAVQSDGFFASLAHRESADRPQNEAAIRGIV